MFAAKSFRLILSREILVINEYQFEIILATYISQVAFQNCVCHLKIINEKVNVALDNSRISFTF